MILEVQPPLSPRILALQRRLVDEGNVVATAEFHDKPNLGYSSYFVNHGIDWNILQSWVDFGNGYRHQAPSSSDRILQILEFGMHGISLVHFSYGFRLSMHPFHLIILEAVGRGVARITPNSMVQVSGFIALCAEKWGLC